MPKRLSLVVAILFVSTSLAVAREDADIPARAPDDAVMAPADEIRAMLDWVPAAWTGGGRSDRQKLVEITVRRQDHNVLRFGQSCMETPIQIGKQKFQHGLGTHANSVIAVRLPPGAKTFQAMVGIDNNYDTLGVRGTVQFSVEIGGKDVLHTPTLKGGQEPVPVNVPIPPGTQEIVLKVDATPDGPAYDQSDWADARVILGDGKTVWLDETDEHFLERQVPFSFRYGKAASAEAMKGWKRTVKTTDGEEKLQHDLEWTDPKTGLCVSAAVTAYKRYPAAEWVLSFENRGEQDTPILEEIQALDVVLRTGVGRKPTILHRLTGDACDEKSFLPIETALEPGKPLAFAPSGGRPSNGAFPLFNVQYGNAGVIVGIGWSGQWAASLTRSLSGPTRLQAGMEKTHLVLHPGERIRSPRILVLSWKGDRLAAHNRFRRLLLYHYVPKQAGRPLRLPIAGQCFDRYWQSRPKWDTEAEQILTAKAVGAVGCDTYWLDAAWFEKGFPNGVGNWYPKPQGFPNGMKPVSDAAHRLGMKYLMWFEPERVAAGSQIAREHPEFVFGGSGGGLYKLSDTAARKFMTELLARRIREFGMDVYRNDFNIDPLGFWRNNDPPDRQGITEIRYVEGHYAMWDGLLARYPGLWIDNCASGGRRIDLESIMRSVPLWRSDTSCSPGHPDWNQTQTYGLSLYIPLFTAAVWVPDAYDVRSAATGGLICQFDVLNPEFPLEKAKAAVAEVKANQKFWYGDFYPLTRCDLGADQWAAYQFHRPDLDAGLVLAFRRAECNYPALSASLRGIKPERQYAVEFIDDARQAVRKTLPGRQLADDLELRIPKKGASLLVRYRPSESKR
jgi:alpha-galactosidase